MITYALLLYGISHNLIGNTVQDFLVYALCGAQVGMINITVGHELVHRKELVCKVTGNLPYAKALYSHFFIEHVYVHHKHVATREDPQTARLGESLYQYFARAIPDGYRQTWKFEKENREGLLRNRVLLMNLGHVAYLAGVYYFFGVKTLCFHLLYSVLMILMFEAINYLEHYGLERRALDNDLYEPVSHKHSWNAPHQMTNLLLFKL